MLKTWLNHKNASPSTDTSVDIREPIFNNKHITFKSNTLFFETCIKRSMLYINDFMRNDHLGWVLTCPSNLGTGLRAGAMVKDRV